MVKRYEKWKATQDIRFPIGSTARVQIYCKPRCHLIRLFKPMGASFRITLIFPDLRENLESVFEEARKNSPYWRVRDLPALPTLHAHSNPSTTAKKIVLRAKVEPWIKNKWVNFLNSLRAYLAIFQFSTQRWSFCVSLQLASGLDISVQT